MSMPGRSYVEAVLLHEARLIVMCLVIFGLGAFLCGRASANGTEQCVVEQCIGEQGPPGEPGTCEESCEERPVCSYTIELCDLPKNPCNKFRGRYVCYYDALGLEMFRVKPLVRARKGEKRMDALLRWIEVERENWCMEAVE